MTETVPASEPPPIVVAGVTKRWPERRRWFFLRRRAEAEKAAVLDAVDLVVRRGEIFALLGENGAGKTTLLKIVAGLARADAGSVSLFGYGEPGSSPELRRRVSYGGGERGFYYRLTARENLDFFARLEGLGSGERRAQVERSLEIVDLARAAGKRFADLSTGMRQRLSIARTLIGDPDVLLLDEPTRALDPLHAGELRAFVRETLVRGLGKTVIVATNLLDEAFELADRGAVLRAARLHEFDVGAGRDALPPPAILFGAPSRA